MSTTSSATSTTSTVTFSGSSTYSSSFQQVLQRAVSIASLPMEQLQGEVTTLQSKQSDVTGLQTIFGNLQSALQSVASSMSGGVSASSSDSSLVVAAAQSNTLPGTYSIQVNDIGSTSSTISAAGSSAVTSPSSQNISSSLSYTLTVNGTPKTLTLSSGTLDALASAINNSNDGVSATIVNLGSNSSPDYRLSVISNQLGPDTIQLNDGSKDLLSSLNTGTLAKYQVNGNSTVLTSTSDQVTLAPGLTATLVDSSPGTNVNITVATDESGLSSALSSFVTAYNTAVSAVNTEHGTTGAGNLKGESIVFELQSVLSKIAQSVSSSGSVNNLTDLGLNLDSSGSMSFDSSKFSSQQSSGIQQFLGGLTTGGFLQSVNEALNGVTDSSTGLLASEADSITTAITNDNKQISTDQTRVNNLQTNLQKQLTAADAAITVLQEQSTYFTNLFQTMNANKMAGLS